MRPDPSSPLRRTRLAPIRLAMAALAALLAAACATVAPAPPETQVRHWPEEHARVIVSTGSFGRFEARAGCIWFDFAHPLAETDAALFPPGTRLTADRRGVLLPDGETIPFGRRVAVEYQRGPHRPDLDRTCGREPIEVLQLEDDPPGWWR